MFCAGCGAETSTNATFCPACGKALPKVAVQPPAEPLATSQPQSPTASSVTQGFRLDATRWNSADRIAGGGTIVLFISLFLPWFGITGLGEPGISLSGLDAHGYLYISLLLSLAIIGYLVARGGWRELPFKLPFAHAPMLFVAATANLVLVALGVLLKPGGPVYGWDFGAFLAFIAALVAVLPFAIPLIQARRGSPS